MGLFLQRAGEGGSPVEHPWRRSPESFCFERFDALVEANVFRLR